MSARQEGALSSLVFIDLPLSGGTHSEPASEARQTGIGLAPQEPCGQNTMKLEAGKQEEKKAHLMLF